MNWLALGTEESVVTCNNDGVCNGEESCNCADCNTKADHCALDGAGQQLLCMKNTAPAWIDVPLTSAEPFDSSCEYRFKRNFDPTSLGLSNASGDYWFYASAVFPSNIVETSHGGKVSHIYATSKTRYRVNGNDAAYTDIIISQMQKRCDEWADINPSTSETFGPLDEYRYKRSFDPTYYGLSNASGDYWYYISGVNQNNIIDTSDTSLISHMYAPSKTKYRVNGNDAAYTDITISQMQKRSVSSGWTDVPLDASSSYDSTCEYRFKRNFDPTSLGLSNASGDYWFYASAVFPSNIVENPQ